MIRSINQSILPSGGGGLPQGAKRPLGGGGLGVPGEVEGVVALQGVGIAAGLRVLDVVVVPPRVQVQIGVVLCHLKWNER